MKTLTTALTWTFLPLLTGLSYALSMGAMAGVMGVLAGCLIAAMIERF